MILLQLGQLVGSLAALTNFCVSWLTLSPLVETNSDLFFYQATINARNESVTITFDAIRWLMLSKSAHFIILDVRAWANALLYQALLWPQMLFYCFILLVFSLSHGRSLEYGFWALLLVNRPGFIVISRNEDRRKRLICHLVPSWHSPTHYLRAFCFARRSNLFKFTRLSTVIVKAIKRHRNDSVSDSWCNWFNHPDFCILFYMLCSNWKPILESYVGYVIACERTCFTSAALGLVNLKVDHLCVKDVCRLRCAYFLFLCSRTNNCSLLILLG